jgi:hypothetical protein
MDNAIMSTSTRAFCAAAQHYANNTFDSGWALSGPVVLKTGPPGPSLPQTQVNIKLSFSRLLWLDLDLVPGSSKFVQLGIRGGSTW